MAFRRRLRQGRFLGFVVVSPGGSAALLVLWASRVLFNRLRTPRPHRMPLPKRLELLLGLLGMPSVLQGR